MTVAQFLCSLIYSGKDDKPDRISVYRWNAMCRWLENRTAEGYAWNGLLAESLGHTQD